MPRNRTGLGQGLEALVPPIRDPATIASLSRPAPSSLTWEVAVLKKTGRRRSRLTIAPAGALERPRRQRLKVSTMLALGALSAAGWELVAVSRGAFYLKRPTPAEA